MYGKLLGALLGIGLGLAFSSPVLAALLAFAGIFLGHRVDTEHAERLEAVEPVKSLEELEALGEPGRSPAPGGSTLAAADLELEAERRAGTGRPERQASAEAFARSLCALFVEVARADGPIAREEVAEVRRFFQEELRFQPAELEVVRLGLKDALTREHDLQSLSEEARESLGNAERLLLLHSLFELARSDGAIGRAEREAIETVAQGLDIDAEEYASLAALYIHRDTEPYRALGLEPDATDDEIRRAFRRLASAHHPDRVAHLGAGAAELSARRFRALREAYETIRERRRRGQAPRGA